VEVDGGVGGFFYFGFCFKKITFSAGVLEGLLYKKAMK
jgi:hypothetical protein